MIIKEKTKDVLNTPEKVYKIIKSVLSLENEVDQDKEHFWVIGLNKALRLIYLELVSLGSLDSTIVEPREVFRMAIMRGVSSIIVAHNHPSGEIRPSIDDDNVTKKLVDGGKILKINVLDHIIVGDGFYSYKKESRI